MAKWGSFDFGDFKDMANSFKKAVDERLVEQWMREFLLEMAYRADAKIKKRTPVGKTGELRRNWQVGEVKKVGNDFIVEIYNNTYYAPFVEYGHRTGKELTEWVEGKFMMTISMKEIEREMPKFFEKKQMELLNKIMNGGKG